MSKGGVDVNVSKVYLYDVVKWFEVLGWLMMMK